MMYQVVCTKRTCGGKLKVEEQGPGRCPPYRCTCVACGHKGGVTVPHAMAIMATQVRMGRMLPSPERRVS